MKIATWNVNSIRQRLDRAAAWLGRHQPDVLCLQEIKCSDDEFPAETFAALGYRSEVYGQKSYNGMALLVKEEAVGPLRGFPGEAIDAPRRLLAAKIRGVWVVGVYVPNGQSLTSDKFPYKLDWLVQLREFFAATFDPAEPLVLLGDFNIAPEDRDVYDPDLFRGQVLFHPAEHERLRALQDWGLYDLFRKHHSEGGLYSWWDYRMLGFPKNRGLRIDLILGTAPMLERCTACYIDREERKGKLPSDHAPVVAEFTG